MCPVYEISDLNFLQSLVKQNKKDKIVKRREKKLFYLR